MNNPLAFTDPTGYNQEELKDNGFKLADFGYDMKGGYGVIKEYLNRDRGPAAGSLGYVYNWDGTYMDKATGKNASFDKVFDYISFNSLGATGNYAREIYINAMAMNPNAISYDDEGNVHMYKITNKKSNLFACNGVFSDAGNLLDPSSQGDKWNPYEPYSVEMDNQATINLLTGIDGGGDDVSFILGSGATIAGYMNFVKKSPAVGAYITLTTTYVSTLLYLNSKLSGNILTNYNNIVDKEGNQLPREGVIVNVYPSCDSFSGWGKSAEFYDKHTGIRLGFLPFY